MGRVHRHRQLARISGSGPARRPAGIRKRQVCEGTTGIAFGGIGMTATASPPAPATNGNGGLAKQQQGPTLRDLLEKRRELIADVLPKHMTPERLIKLATVATARDPILARATALSIVNAVIKAAELGLDCSGT